MYVQEILTSNISIWAGKVWKVQNDVTLMQTLFLKLPLRKQNASSESMLLKTGFLCFLLPVQFIMIEGSQKCKEYHKSGFELHSFCIIDRHNKSSQREFVNKIFIE